MYYSSNNRKFINVYVKLDSACLKVDQKIVSSIRNTSNGYDVFLVVSIEKTTIRISAVYAKERARKKEREGQTDRDFQTWSNGRLQTSDQTNCRLTHQEPAFPVIMDQYFVITSINLFITPACDFGELNLVNVF